MFSLVGIVSKMTNGSAWKDLHILRNSPLLPSPNILSSRELFLSPSIVVNQPVIRLLLQPPPKID